MQMRVTEEDMIEVKRRAPVEEDFDENRSFRVYGNEIRCWSEDFGITWYQVIWWDDTDTAVSIPVDVFIAYRFIKVFGTGGRYRLGTIDTTGWRPNA